MKHVLFLCTGNLNRSYAAHAIAQELLADYEIDSAGTGKTAGGKIANKKMREALLRQQFVLPIRKSKKMTQELLDWADVVVCMADVHRRKMIEQFGLPFLSKCVMMDPDGDIPDPHFSKDDEDFDIVVNMIQDNMRDF